MLSTAIRAITVAIATYVVMAYIAGDLSFQNTVVALIAAILWVETIYNGE